MVFCKIKTELMMSFHKFKYNYHDSILESYNMINKNQIELLININPISNEGTNKQVSLTFYDIDNCDEVANYMESKIKTSKLKDIQIIDIQKSTKTDFLIDFDVGDLQLKTREYLEI